MSKAPAPILTFILRTVSRGKYRETVGNSSGECRGLVDLLAAEAQQKPGLRRHVDAVLALAPDHAIHPNPLTSADRVRRKLTPCAETLHGIPGELTRPRGAKARHACGMNRPGQALGSGRVC